MFGFFTSEQKRARRDAHNWLHLANRVYHFRRDQLPPAELQALQQATLELRGRLKERADAAKLKMAMDKLEGCLRQSGGCHYPKSSLVDNLEFFLVAAILFLGIRAFFIQPFKIPTNSMWPSYYGMTADIFDTPQDEPGVVEDALRFLAFGASRVRLIAPHNGEIKLMGLPVNGGGFTPFFRKVTGRKWLVIPTEMKEYPILVGNTPVWVRLPWDFRFDRVLERVYGSDNRTLHQAASEARNAGRFRMDFALTDEKGRPYPVLEVSTGRMVETGGRVLAFDVMTGDQLFVDRVSYHFMKPSVGDGFVFRTGNIAEIKGDQYYVKRLVGLPGDTLEVRPPVLYRNGAPIEGAAAFGRNARHEGLYPGYTFGPLGATYLREPGATVTVPENGFFAMGDNSPDSSDSRYWGFVPAQDVVGRPLFIYYPFTRRWGPTR